MNATALFDALTEINERFLDRAFVAPASPVKTKRPRRRFAVLAECACLLLVAGTVLFLYYAVSTYVPTFGDAAFSAAEVADMAGLSRMTDGTKAYRRIDVSDDAYLYIEPLPSDEYLPIYGLYPQNRLVTEENLRAFADRYYGKICAAFGVPEAELQFRDEEDPSRLLDLMTKEQPFLSFSLNRLRESFHFSPGISKDAASAITLDGQTVSIDPAMTDEEIAASLEWAREKLCALFDVDLPDVGIERTFHVYSSETDCIYVTFYKKADAPGHVWSSIFYDTPCDRIVITFYCKDNGWRPHSDVQFTRYLPDAVRTVANVKRISLERAEKLLYGGYVFGIHACPLCMAKQPEVDFHGYAYATIRYFRGVPFYAFYKLVGINEENGIRVYAEALVPAFEVYGLEEYFENQRDLHRE